MQCRGKGTGDNNPDLGLMFQYGVEEREENIKGLREKEYFHGSRVFKSITRCMNCMKFSKVHLLRYISSNRGMTSHSV
jgi:hypothetical protein